MHLTFGSCTSSTDTDSKQDAGTTTAHSKLLISLLKNEKVLTTSLITIWENTDGCVEQYKCASALYLMPVISQTYSLIIHRGMSATGNGKEVVDGLNAVDTRYIYQLMSKVQLPGSIIFDSQIKIHTGKERKYVSLSSKIKNHLEGENCKNNVIDQGKSRKRFINRKWTEKKYHIQDNADVELKYVKIYCNTNQFSALPFCVPHSKTHGARGLSKHYNLRFDPKIGERRDLKRVPPRHSILI